MLRSVLLLGITCLLISQITAKKEASTRKMEVEWNPQCNSRPECDSVQNGSYVNLVYVKATGEQDIVHYFYSTIKSFSILIFKSDLKGKVQIDWDKILNDEPNSIQIKGVFKILA